MTIRNNAILKRERQSTKQNNTMTKEQMRELQDIIRKSMMAMLDSNPTLVKEMIAAQRSFKRETASRYHDTATAGDIDFLHAIERPDIHNDPINITIDDLRELYIRAIDPDADARDDESFTEWFEDLPHTVNVVEA